MSSYAARPSALQSPRELENYERFEFEILFEATTDSQGVWEPLWYLRGNVRSIVPLPALSEEEHQLLAEAVLRDLWRDGLIFFYRETENLDADLRDPATHLSPQEVDAVLRGSDWRTVSIRTDVWFFATLKGERAWKDYAKETWPRKGDEPA
jgi:hypothetical protein